MTLALSAAERAGLHSYLRRVLALDDRAAVRVQARGLVAGVWSGPPFGVLALRPLALLGEAEVDATVSARRLLEALDDAARLRLPPGVVGPVWAAQLPPRGGWLTRAVVPVATVAAQVAVAVEAFQRRADALAEPARTPEALERLAEDVWGQTLVLDLPLRMAHAAVSLGLLGEQGEVRAAASGAWRRLACPGGSVLWRSRSPGLPLGVTAESI
ncbi:MAG TPA: hypothetical protein VMI11_05170 [Actinomycetes bacterium]|nr:hypothetical protein [Actinomycetes bacterium]